VALRSALASRHHFGSRCDSEVILHLFEEVGADCARELDGMFAFFASDGQSFVAARDPFGIKPLYYGRTRSGGWLFASEGKAVSAECPIFSALKPGSYITDSGAEERWFRPAWANEVGRERNVTPADIAERLEGAVVKRLMSDVPLGVFLSGGLDSSVVAEIAARHCPGLKTFSVGVSGASDLAAARQVARALGSRHFELVYTPDDVERALPEVVRHLESYDAALIRSAIPCYFLSRLAAEQVKIALTGEGADELLGGYGYFSGITARDAFHQECVRLLFGLHGMNLQRVDRMTMAHGLEGRVPFLDVDFVELMMGIDPELKQWGGTRAEKGLLRAAFGERLPEHIVTRRKLEFSRGSGVEPSLRQLAERLVSDRDMLLASASYPVDTPSTKEELLYRRIFEDAFPGEMWRASVQRWRPVAQPVTAPEAN
jgi:asparagine synthase (glutamine-hydrolysing)